MSKKIRNIVSILLAGVVLIASTGITLHKHNCLKKGTSEISLVQEKHSCCAEKPASTEVNHCQKPSHTQQEPEKCPQETDDCCEFEHFFLKQDIQANIFTPKVVAFLVFWTLAPHSWQQIALQTRFSTQFIPDKSPPFWYTGQERLRYFQIFRI